METTVNSSRVRLHIDHPPASVRADGPCGICDTDPAYGYAKINDTWYCHDDRDIDCYLLGQRVFSRRGDLANAIPADEFMRLVFGEEL